MYYIPDFLTRRNRSSLARIWLAATLNKQNFTRICKSREVNSIDVYKSCEEVQSLITGQHESKMKLSLYLSAQLMYGIVKIHSYQITALGECLQDVRNSLRPFNIKKLNKELKKRKNLVDSVDFPNVINLKDPFSMKFLKETDEPDCHLIEEIPIEFPRKFDEVGELDRMSSEEVRRMLSTIRNTFAENSNETTKFGESRENPRIDTSDNPNVHDPDISEPPRPSLGDLDINRMREFDTPQTPTKRRMPIHVTNTDNFSPSKRPRQNLRRSLEDIENIPPNTPIEQSTIQRDNGTIGTVPTMPDIDKSNTPETDQVHHPVIDDPDNPDTRPIDGNETEQELPKSTPIDNSNDDLLLDSIVVDKDLPRRRKKFRDNIDIFITISADQYRNQTQNVAIMTRSLAETRPNFNRIRLDSQLLFKNPATLCNAKLTRNYSNKLQSLFKMHICGPFHVDTDESLFAESVRFPNRTEKTAELSEDVIIPRPGPTDESSDKVIDEMIPRIDDIPPVELGTVDVPTDIGVSEIENEPPILDSHDDTERARRSEMSSVSTFYVPPNGKGTASARHSNASTDKTININDVSTSRRSRFQSDSSTSDIMWTKESLYDELKTRWEEIRDRRGNPVPIDFATLFEPGLVSRTQVSCGLLDLFYLVNDKLITVNQDEPFAIIWILIN